MHASLDATWWFIFGYSSAATTAVLGLGLRAARAATLVADRDLEIASLRAQLDAAADRALERADAYQALADQLILEREHRPARGAHGRFARRA